MSTIPLAITFIDLDGLESIDPVSIIVFMIALIGAMVTLGAIGIANLFDRRKGGA